MTDIVERLQNAINPDARVRVDPWEAMAAGAIDEITRLRSESADILAAIPLLIRGSNAGRDAEIARLRDEIADWQRTVRAHEFERNELEGEVERLTGLLDRAYRLAVGHGLDGSVFDTWEDAIDAYAERLESQGDDLA